MLMYFSQINTSFIPTRMPRTSTSKGMRLRREIAEEAQFQDLRFLKTSQAANNNWKWLKT